MNFEDLKGKTLTKIYGASIGSTLITFDDSDGNRYRMLPDEDEQILDVCDVWVEVEDIVGDINDLLNSEIIMAEEKISGGATTKENPEPPLSLMWTFYKLATIKGYVTIRWRGESNGYYRERVNFEKI